MLTISNIPLHWINRLSFVSRKHLVQRFKSAGHNIRAEEWAVLLLLWQEDGQTPSSLAERTIRDRTTMTRMIDTMYRKGLVTRVSDANDRRKSVINLSAKGRDLQTPLTLIAQVLINESLAGLDQEDIETTLRVLKKMTNNLLEI